jgi:hypothetical protein
MGFLLLAIEILTTMLLLVALVVALVSRRGAWFRWASIAVVLILLLGFFGLTIIGNYRLEAGTFPMATGLSAPLIAMAIVFALGACVVIWRGHRRLSVAEGEMLTDTDRRPAAQSWPRGKLALAFGVAAALGLMTLSNLDAAARQSIGELRGESYALAMSLAPQPVADEENAATYYAQAFEALDRLYANQDRPENRFYKAWSEADDNDVIDYASAAATEFCQAHQGEVELLRTGAALPHYYYDRNYGQIDVATLLPDIQNMRGGARLLDIHARWSLTQSNLKGALADVTAIGGLARHAAGDVFVVTMLVGAALDGVAFDTLQASLRSAYPTADELAAARVNHLFSYRRQVSRVLRGDEVAMLNTMFDMDSALALSTATWLTGADRESTYFGYTARGFAMTGLSPVYRTFVLLPMMARYRREMDRLHASTSMPYAEFQERRVALEADFQSQGGAMSAGSLFSSLETTYRADARNLVAYTALAMHRYRAEHGKFPDTLEALTPTTIAIVPSDPYIEQPLKLAKSDRGWVVYSVGPDRADNHGAPPGTDQKGLVQFQGDIGFEYVEPEKP